MANRWLFKTKPNAEEVKSLSSELNINPFLSTLLLQRGINTFQDAKDFFRPNLAHLNNPFLLKDMDKAIDRISDAIAAGENILVYGDYDVDGTTSVALVHSFFERFSENIGFYVPDRYKEGYGISLAAIDFAEDNGIDLIIALDCGIRAIKQIEYANTKGIDVIVCDHHIPGKELPPAYAILNAKQTDCNYPYKELCGVGVGFKLVQAFCEQNTIPFSSITSLLQYAAIGTCADIVPLTGENRIIVHFGLKEINEHPLPGIHALILKAKLTFPLNGTNVVFGIAPRINAAGRMAHASHSVEVLLQKDLKQAEKWASEIEAYNENRKNLDGETTKEALEMIQESAGVDRYSTVLFNKTWNKGIIGIVASRCIEQYYKPTIILTESGGKLTGSARSVADFDIHEALEHCAEHLEQFGGHKFAAGLTLNEDNLIDFANAFEQHAKQSIKIEDTQPTIEIDEVLPFSGITDKFYAILAQMEPYGPCNMRPVFVTENVMDSGGSKIVKEEHVKLSLIQDGIKMDGIAFGMADKFPIIKSGKPFKICYSLDENTFRERTTLQLFIRDITE